MNDPYVIWTAAEAIYTVADACPSEDLADGFYAEADYLVDLACALNGGKFPE